MEEITKIELEIFDLKRQIALKEEKIRGIQAELNPPPDDCPDKLTNDEISRYCRQIILPQIGVKGQLKLRESSVLVVGAGGLGCPALLHLASVGIGELGIFDNDEVEIHNLHRQTLHYEASIGKPKSISAKEALLKINSKCNIKSYNYAVTADSETSVLRIIENYDLVLDCTDNVATRYLLNDACVLTGKPLISGSALKLEGQLTVYNYKGGPCYRCIFPTPPPPETVSNCGDAGVLGAVTGVIGCLQALETIKILLDKDCTLSGRLLIFDGVETTFRNVKLRPRRINCDVCSANPIINNLIDYEQFCGMRASDKNISLSLLDDDQRIRALEYNKIKSMNEPHLLVDVRSPGEFEICRLENSINIPLKEILEGKALEGIKEKITKDNIPVFVVCRRGNDSQIAVEHLQEKLGSSIQIKDIMGGLFSWHYECDMTFPIY